MWSVAGGRIRSVAGGRMWSVAEKIKIDTIYYKYLTSKTVWALFT